MYLLSYTGVEVVDIIWVISLHEANKCTGGSK